MCQVMDQVMYLEHSNVQIIQRNILMLDKKMEVIIFFNWNNYVMKHWQDQSYYLPAINLI